MASVSFSLLPITLLTRGVDILLLMSISPLSGVSVRGFVSPSHLTTLALGDVAFANHWDLS